MTSIDKTGSSIEQIIASFRREYRIKDWELRYDVLKKPSAGILGLFARKSAVVRFELPSPGERAAAFLEILLQKMSIPFEKVTHRTDGKAVHLEIRKSEESGMLIGKNGHMLETLQYLVNRVFENDRGADRFFIDIEGYRERREAAFLRPLLPVIKKVRETGKAQTLDPMDATERRVIHRHIERERGLRTLTVGEGEKKRIVIFSGKQSEAEALGQAAKQQPATGEGETRGRSPRPKPKAAESAAPDQARKPRPRRPQRKRPATQEENANQPAQDQRR